LHRPIELSRIDRVTVSVPAPPKLLERDELLAALRGALADAGGGRGRLVLVAGEAGIGKTAVVREFCAEEPQGAAVLSGACDALFTPRPLGPFVDIAEQSGGAIAETLEAGGGPHEVVAALLRPATPAILVLEDVHWADEATLDVLRLLARSVGRAPVLVVVTYRDDELEPAHPLRVVLGELVTRPAVTRLAVTQLSPAAVAELAAPRGVDPAELYRQTSGNPFFVSEVLATGRGAMPETVRDAVLGRAARLSPAARAVLEAAAISPQRVEVWLLEALVGEHAEAFPDCLASGMLTARRGAVEFRHELARVAIEETLEPRRRIALHRRALAALESPPAGAPDAARLAHHAEAAGDVPAVLRYATAAAAAAAALGAHREAAAQYGRALRFADVLDLETRAGLLRRYSDSCYLTDRCDDAIEAAEQLLACYRTTGDRFREGETLCLLSQLQMCPGSVLDAEPAGRQAIALLEEFPTGAELAMAYANLAAIAMNAEDAAGTRRWGRRAVELAEPLGDTHVLAHVLNSLGTMEFLAHGPAHREQVERSLALALDAGLEVHVLRAYSNMTWAAWRHRDCALAERFLQAGLARCQAPDFDLWRLQMCGYRACLRLEQGRWEEAAESAAIALGDPRSSPLPRILGMVVLGLLRARRGDPQARTLLGEALAMAAPSGELQRLAPAAAAAAEAAWQDGERAAVADITGSVLALAVERDALWLVGQLACWRRRAGIEPMALPPVPDPWRLELNGNPAEAAAVWRELGCAYEAALALAQCDDVPSLRRAHEELLEIGAPTAAAIPARGLRARGVRGLPRGPRPSTRRNDARLTAREIDVLRLLAVGLRNAAIAERLFLSPRTVDAHVRAILRKLDAGNRGEAVAAAGRLGVLEDQ
jgi:DNA-binding CsgD family transcriptional regulator/tetratricopeptide (TPR) repeat protein